MKNKKIIIISLSIALVIAILGISITSFTIKENNNEIKIGWIGDLSGDAAIVGQENLRGVELAIDEINSQGGINNKKIKLFVQDDQYSEKNSISAYRELVDIHNIKYIFIETYGGYLALASQAEKDQVILINTIDSSEEFSNIGENAYSIGVYDESIGYTIADYLNERNIQEVGLVTNLDDAFPVLTSNAFKERFQGKVIEETYGFNTNDFRALLTKLSNQDHIVLVGWKETGRIIKQAKELGLNPQIYGIDTFASEDFKTNTNGNYNGLIFSFWEGSENNLKFKKLVKDYKKKYNKEPENELFLVAGYDSASVLLNALKNSNNDIENIKQNLENTKDFQGAAGTITIDHDHITRSIKESMYTYKDEVIVKA